ncbi:MAG: dksA [Herminiimonas sp.]|nr:dksA [Herminiimonas sp.]
MNATVTTSGKKSSTAKKPTVSAKAKPAEKAIGKSRLKAVTEKLAKKITSALKPASKVTKPLTKTAVKPARSPVKSSAKPAVKAVPKTTKPAIAKKTAPATKKTATVRSAAQAPGKTGAAGKQSAQPVRAAAPKTALPAVKATAVAAPETNSKVMQSGVLMSSNKTSARLTDKIEQTVVSKVSEVATKTMKPTPTVLTDGALLSEAQILKMSEKDYMNAAQLAFFKARLQQLEKDLLKNAGETTEHLRETVLVPDPADRATIEEEHALELRTRDRERKLLKKVQQSIASIDSGDYGWCEETGEPIGIPRLLARPTATLSLEAQQRRELKQKLYGD